jgi:tRNA(His) 5'-end guanylyltransferase
LVSSFPTRFSTIHSFDKPNDESALRLMNESASLMMEQYPDIVFGYGFSNEYRYVILLKITVHGDDLIKKKNKFMICTGKNICFGWHSHHLMNRSDLK